MKKKNLKLRTYQLVADMFNQSSCNIYEDTRAFAQVSESGITISTPHYASCFYHLERVVDLARSFGLLCYAKAVDNDVIIRIY